MQYPGANIPQAWAAGSVFQLVTAMLGLRADAPNRVLYVAPTLPAWLPDLELLNVQVGDARLRLRFTRAEDHTDWEVLEVRGGTCEVRLDPAHTMPARRTAGGPGAALRTRGRARSAGSAATPVRRRDAAGVSRPPAMAGSA